MTPTTETIEASPRTRVLELINANWTTQAIRTACLLELPDRLAGGEQSVTALARACGCDTPALRRLLNALVTLELCTEAGDDRYGLAPLGGLLRDDATESLRSWALLVGGAHWERWGGLEASVRSGLSHRRRHGVPDGFAALEGEAAALFHRAMVELTRAVAQAFVARVELAGVRQVVDVGGGSGELLATVLAARPEAHGVLFDLPAGLVDAPAVLARAGVAARCRCVAGSFFDTLPENADAYLLKSVLHNWDDDHGVELLARCRSAMARDARLWVLERVVSDRPGTSPRDRAIARSDLNMLVAQSGRERRLGEFVALFEAAGLALVGEVDLGESGFSALTVVAR
jgi:hypothetical protein